MTSSIHTTVSFARTEVLEKLTTQGTRTNEEYSLSTDRVHQRRPENGNQVVVLGACNHNDPHHLHMRH